MSSWKTTLKTEQLGKWKHKVIIEPLVLMDDEYGEMIVPVDYITDFASVKALQNIFLFPIYALVAGYGNYASTLHDYLYDYGTLTRKECDSVLYRGLRGEGVARWRAYLFWLGVRMGGGSRFKTLSDDVSENIVEK